MEFVYVKIAAYVMGVICFFIAIGQALLAVGLPFGEYAFGGRYRVLPKTLRIASFFSIFTIIFMAVVFLQQGGVINLGIEFLNAKSLMWIFTAFFVLNTVANLASESKKEKIIMSPLTIIGAISGIIIAVWG